MSLRAPRNGARPALFAALLTLLLAAADVAAAQEIERQRVPRAQAEIVDLALTRAAGILEASFRLDEPLGQELMARIESGLPTTLTYVVIMERPRRWWWNRTLGRTDLQLIAMYNAVTREYLVNFKQDGDLVESRVVRTREELQRAMTQVDRLALSRFDAPTSDSTVVRLRAELGSRNWLGIVPTTVHTPWVEITMSETTQLPPTPTGRPSTLR